MRAASGTSSRLFFRIAWINQRTDQIRLMTRLNSFGDSSICLVKVFWNAQFSSNASSCLWSFGNARRINVSVQRKRQRTRNRRCAHGEKIYALSFFAQRCSLINAKRCCSSTTARVSCLNTTRSERSAVVPKTTDKEPSARQSSICCLSSSEVEPVIRAHVIPASESKGPIF